MSQPRPALASRLRELRKEHWPDVEITQKQLATAFELSTGLLSSWENTGRPVTPPPARLDTYATFFATHRSVEGQEFQVLSVDELDDEERARREELLRELNELRDKTDEGAAQPEFVGDNLWRFPENQDIVIVCARLPQDLAHQKYSNPLNPDYVQMYTYADPDALLELYGHVRACNPASRVTYRTTDQQTPLTADEYTEHLVLLGGVDWNPLTKELFDLVNLPVKQVERDDDAGQHGGFEVQTGDRTELFRAELGPDDRLLSDVAHFYHGISPFNRLRTVTVCNGMYGRGTLGAVRALTDVRFRDRNQAYLNRRFGDEESFSIITRVRVFNNQGLTPDWSLAENRLHEWPEKSTT
ncbi:helix-turn-helix domain-containing protein [Amycolatopsis tolypomycina]|uniref:Transcriptional regulator, contains XRE-family HTH domain n=1 Tax=Amycolatopsis tolypomycina TaxID=208445 RepID=A0A1H4ZQ86_9PSEU|nr:helix-turn-helix transcriptional regulator [Amycolatopsis tolypomycina]SED32157.1 Transcriptional regulator, contains XRE-family HTH domain [Amycolatopsis tolypomycina]